MSRQIDLDNLKPEDREYINQRPWLKDELVLAHGTSFEELFPDDSDASEDEDPENDGDCDDSGDGAGAGDPDGDGDDTEDDEDGKPYSEWDYADLVDEVKTRNEGRAEEDKIKPNSRSGNDLISALEADDSNE